jgi:hypothetical protein
MKVQAHHHHLQIAILSFLMAIASEPQLEPLFIIFS